MARLTAHGVEMFLEIFLVGMIRKSIHIVRREILCYISTTLAIMIGAHRFTSKKFREGSCFTTPNPVTSTSL